MNLTGIAGAALAAAAVVAALGVGAAGPARGAPARLEIASLIPAEHASSKAMEVFRTEAARLSQGSVEIVIRRDSQRSLKELIEDVHAGRLFATWSSTGMFARMVPEMSAVSLPFAFKDYDEARAAVSGPVGALLAARLEAKGFVTLAFMDQGAMQIANARRPLKTLADLQGLTIRVLPGTTHAAAFKAVGARPVTMEIADVAATLNQGDVDGLELNYATIYANRYFEKQKYLSDTGHFRDFHVLVAGKETFAGLDPGQQQAVREAARIAAVRQHVMSATDETVALTGLRAEGLQFDPLPADTRTALRRAMMAGVIDDVRNTVGADVVNAVLAARRRTAADKPAGTAARR